MAEQFCPNSFIVTRLLFPFIADIRQHCLVSFLFWKCCQECVQANVALWAATPCCETKVWMNEWLSYHSSPLPRVKLSWSDSEEPLRSQNSCSSDQSHQKDCDFTPLYAAALKCRLTLFCFFLTLYCFRCVSATGRQLAVWVTEVIGCVHPAQCFQLWCNGRYFR